MVVAIIMYSKVELSITFRRDSIEADTPASPIDNANL